MKHLVIRERNNLIETIRSTVSDQLAIGHRRYRHSDESAAERAAIGFRGTIWPKTERRSVRLYPSVPLAVPGRLAVIFFTSLILLLLLFLLFQRPLSTFAILVVPVSAGHWEKRWFHSAGMVTRCARRIYTRDSFVPVMVHCTIVVSAGYYKAAAPLRTALDVEDVCPVSSQENFVAALR